MSLMTRFSFSISLIFCIQLSRCVANKPCDKRRISPMQVYLREADIRRLTYGASPFNEESGGFRVAHGAVSLFAKVRQPPGLPRRLQRSTFGRPGLNRRVRDGNGCDPGTHRHRRGVCQGASCGDRFPLTRNLRFLVRDRALMSALKRHRPCLQAVGRFRFIAAALTLTAK